MQAVGSEQQKRQAAVRAAEWNEDGMVLGLGTGSTVRYLLEEIAARREAGDWQRIVGVPTSTDTARRAGALGIPLSTLGEHPDIDLTIDGADEVDPQLNLIKGLGGALLREKIVAAVSARVVVVADSTKRVAKLGTRSPLPVEVDPFGEAVQPAFLEALGAVPQLRLRQDGSPLVTDGGNLIYDCRFPNGIDDPAALEVRIKARPGIIECGLFVGLADHVVVAAADEVVVLSRPEPLLR